MNDAIRRRGPDAEGYFEDENVALAIRRLSIIDLSTGDQPIFNEDKSIVVVFNGEIYNYRTLRAGLESRGHEFSTNSDTEVVVHLYEEHGELFARHLRGMFAIALWDKRRQVGYLVRDHFGIKPLYYSPTPSGVLFGSEIKAILAAGLTGREIDHQALDAYVAYGYFPAPLSIYSRIRKLLPGGMLRFESGEIEDIQWFDWREEVDKTNVEPLDLNLVGRIRDSVQAHLASDVPVASFLSGGVDSSLVVGLMAAPEHLETRAYTIAFQHSGDLVDESGRAASFCKRLGVPHETLQLQPTTFEILAEAIDAFDEPFGDDSVIPTSMLAKHVASDYKVALTGLGGDEFFGGYTRYNGMALMDSFFGFDSGFLRMMSRLLSKSVLRVMPENRFSDRLSRFLEQLGQPAEKVYLGFVSALDSSKRRDLFSDEVKSKIDTRRTELIIEEPFLAVATSGVVDRAMFCDVQTYMPEDVLALTDRIAMWHSLELRVPLVDIELAKASLHVAANQKVTVTHAKRALKNILEKNFNLSFRGERKQGFEAPVSSWLRKPEFVWVDELLSEDRVRSAGLFEPKVVTQLLTDHKAERADNGKILFRLVMFMLWWDKEVGFPTWSVSET